MRVLPQTQRGAALIIALIMLLMLTLLAVTASRFTLLGTRASLDFQLENTAFQAAEMGITRGLIAVATPEVRTRLDNQHIASPSANEQIEVVTDTFTSDVDYSITRIETLIDTGTTLDVNGQAASKRTRYEIRSTANVRDQNTRSVLRQGFTAFTLQ